MTEDLKHVDTIDCCACEVAAERAETTRVIWTCLTIIAVVLMVAVTVLWR